MAATDFQEISALGTKLDDVAKRGDKTEIDRLVSELDALITALGAPYVAETSPAEVRRTSGTR